MNGKLFFFGLIGIVVALLIVGCTQQTPPVNNTACTQEAKVCPDGSAVGRTGPNCEFAPCPAIVGNDSDAHGCKPSAGYSWCETKQKCLRVWEEPCEGAITVAAARAIAVNSSCMATGNLTGNYAYNNATKTWWFDLDAVRQGCAPACVVMEDSRTAEVNWRCTGLIPPYTVKTANVTGIGAILSDGDGMTLYTFADDVANKSSCYGTCAQNWPPVLVTDQIVIPKGIPGTFRFIIRNDSTNQVTYNDKPLYRYAADHVPGDTNGEGVAGKWHVAQP